MLGFWPNLRFAMLKEVVLIKKREYDELRRIETMNKVLI